MFCLRAAPKKDVMAHDNSESVIATHLNRCMCDPTHRTLIRDAVERTHRIVTDGTELIALHLTRCLQAGVMPPHVDANWVKCVFMEVSAGKGKRTRTDNDLAETRTRLMTAQSATSRQSLDQVLMAEAKSYAATFNTNLHRHMRKRVYGFVQLHLSDQRRDRPLGEHKKHKQALMFVASDLCKPSGVPFESDASHRDWVTKWRKELRLEHLSSWDMSENVEVHQTEMLHASWKINVAFETAEKATFSICPIRRHFVPRFVQIDTSAIGAILSTGVTEHEKVVNRIAEAKRKERARRKAERERIGFPVRVRQPLTPSEADGCIAAAMAGELACIVVQRLWRGFLREVLLQPAR